MRSFKYKMFYTLGVSVAVVGLLFAGSAPVNSLGTITLSGSAQGKVGLFGSPTKTLSQPGLPGANIQLDNDTPASPAPDFVGSANFGDLAAGDGTLQTATFGLRVRGNQKCKVTSSVSAFNANNLTFDDGATSTDIEDLADFTMMTLSAVGGGAGGDGDATARSIDNFWSVGTNNIGAMNSGVVANVTDSKQKVVSFTKKPSKKGNLTDADNWVQTNVSFSLPTGFVWRGTDEENDGDFSLTVQFEVWPDAS